jgi:hypothetical protein
MHQDILYTCSMHYAMIGVAVQVGYVARGFLPSSSLLDSIRGIREVIRSYFCAQPRSPAMDDT